ncbi:MAG: hypothetical protein ABIA04_05030 [Pseudomonadota bacterium]
MKSPIILTIFLISILFPLACEKKTEINFCMDYVQRGVDFYEAGNYNKALLQFKKAENLYPKYYLFPLLSARCYNVLGNSEMAELLYNKALRLKINHYIPLWELAEIQAKKGKNFQAIDTISAAYELMQKIYSSEESKNFTVINESYLEYWLIHKIYKLSLSEASFDFTVSMRLAQLNRRIANYSEMEKWLEKAKIFSNTAAKMEQYYKERGYLELLKGNGNEGFSFFKKALEYQKGVSYELEELIEISKHFIFGDIDKNGFENYLIAIETSDENKVSQKIYLKKACSINKNFLHACLRYAKILANEGADSEAKKILKDLVDKNFASLRVRTDYVLFLQGKLEFSEAIEILNQTLEIVEMSKEDLKILHELKQELNSKLKIINLCQKYFQFLYKRDFKSIYDLHSKFLKERKNQFQFVDKLKQVYEEKFISNCKVTNILLNEKKTLSKLKAICFEKTKADKLKKIDKEVLFEILGEKWGIVSSDIPDVLDDYINAHQGVGGVLN